MDGKVVINEIEDTAISYIGIRPEEYRMLERWEGMAMARERFNTKLRTLKTFYDFSVFRKNMNFFGFRLRGRRSNYTATAFTHIYELDKDISERNHVKYQYGFGVKEGSAYVKNFYKVFKVE